MYIKTIATSLFKKKPGYSIPQHVSSPDDLTEEEIERTLTAAKNNVILEKWAELQRKLFFTDAHMHLFRASSGSPDLMFIRHILKQNVTDRISRTLNALWPFSDTDPIGNIGNYLYNSNKQSNEILTDWTKLFDHYKNLTDVGPHVACLTHIIDMETPLQRALPFIQQGTIYPFRQQLQEVANLALAPHNLGTVLPFVGFDIRRKDLLDTLAFALSQGYIGVKFYCSEGFLPTDPRVMKYLRVFERMQLPLMVHCSNIGLFSFNMNIPLSGKLYEERTGTRTDVDGPVRFWPWRFGPFRGIQELNAPMQWQPVLEELPDLKACFAHVGGKKAIEEHMRGVHSWTTDIFAFAKRYKNVFMDTSYVSVYPKINTYIRSQAETDPALGHKILLGTDYPLDALIDRPQHAIAQMLQEFRTELGLFRSNLARYVLPAS